MSSQTDKGYVDSQYLARLGAVLENVKRATYHHMRVMEGSRVLDVGCGPGTDTIPLAKLVGASGHVAGIDKDAAMIEQANSRAIQNGVAAWTEHRVAESDALPFDDESFDAVRAERLFQHLQNPAPSLREMIRVTRAGGTICVLDTDYASASIAIDEHELERRFTRVVLEHSVKNGYAAREMPLLFQQSNLDEIDLEIVPVVYADYAMARELGRWDTIERIALELDLLNEQEIQHLRASCKRADEQGGFLLHVNMVMVSGRKG